MFIVTCKKNQARVTQTEPITSGSQNVYVVRFDLSEEWDPLVATAVFMAGNRTVINVLLDEDRECMVPWEVMQNAGEQVMVGVFGTMGGNVVLPTIWANMGNLQQGVTTGIYHSEPTPGIYEQIMTQLQRIKGQIENGIPYAIDAIIDTTITSVNNLSNLKLPANIILLNAGFGQFNNAIENGVHYQNEVVFLEILEDQTIRLTDFEGNVFDFTTNEAGDITDKIFVRDGTIKTPYQLAIENGFVGSEKEWLLSLKGPLPVYYTGESIVFEKPLSEIMTSDYTIDKSDLSRVADVDEYVMISVIAEDNESYLITYRIKEVSDTEYTITPAAVVKTTGKTGPQGIQGIQGEQGIQGIQGEQGIQGPIGETGPAQLWLDASSSLETISVGDVVSLSNDDFNRTPVEGETVSGTIVSMTNVFPSYLYFVVAIVQSTNDETTAIRVTLISNLHVTIDGFTPDFITKEDVESMVNGEEVNKPNGVVGIEALQSILKEDVKIEVIYTPTESSNWPDGSLGKEWVWNYPEGLYPRVIMVTEVSDWDYFNAYANNGEVSTVFYSSKVPDVSFRMVAILTDEYVGPPAVIIDHSAAILPTDKGGTGEKTLANAYAKLVEAGTAVMPVSKGGTGETTLANAYAKLVEASTTPLSVDKGGTGVSSLVGTDYSTYRVRAIAVGTTAPADTSNGYLYGIYE